MFAAAVTIETHVHDVDHVCMYYYGNSFSSAKFAAYLASWLLMEGRKYKKYLKDPQATVPITTAWRHKKVAAKKIVQFEETPAGKLI